MSGPAPVPRDPLDVWLHGELLGTLSDRTVGYVAFDFEEEAINRLGPGSLLLSLCMPVSWDTVDPFVATAFFAGLLPEGEARRRLCEEFRVSPEDSFGLLQLIGRESAGALIVIPHGELPAPAMPGELRALGDEQLAAELDRLGQAPLGVTVVDDEIRLSLAGVQDKLPLTRTVDGRLARPLHGHPSTVIAKPARQVERFPEIVQNEAFCLAAADALVPTAEFSILPLPDGPVLLVERYDRLSGADGIALRLHQEDACQATATHPTHKYEAAGGPSLARVADLLDRHSSQPGLDRMTLFRLTVLNAVLGNCDAHGKNLSFLHDQGGVRLAPAYDLVSTAAYPLHSDRLGMRIGGIEQLRDLNRQAFLTEAATLGVRSSLAERILAELAEQLPRALADAEARSAREGWSSAVVEQIAEASRERAGRLLAS